MSEYGVTKWMKTATPFVYARLSTEYQAGEDAGKPIEKQSWAVDQVGAVTSTLKAMGLKQPKKANIYYDLASGNTFDNREGLQKMLEDILNHKGRAFIAIAEPSRWGRNTVRGNALYAPLYERDIPLYSTTDNLLSSTATEPRPNAQFVFNIKQSVSESERGQLQKRVKTKIGQRKASGILSAGVGSLFPFARQDPLDVLKANVALVNVPPSEGGGLGNLGRLIESSTAPFGPKKAYGNNELKRENVRLAKLSPEEYDAWYNFRKKIRELSKSRDYDGGRGAQPVSLKRKDIDFGMKAVMRLSGGYLSQPYDPAYSAPTDELIAEALANPKEYLSDADKKLYRKVVSKR